MAKVDSDRMKAVRTTGRRVWDSVVSAARAVAKYAGIGLRRAWQRIRRS